MKNLVQDRLTDQRQNQEANKNGSTTIRSLLNTRHQPLFQNDGSTGASRPRGVVPRVGWTTVARPARQNSPPPPSCPSRRSSADRRQDGCFFEAQRGGTMMASATWPGNTRRFVRPAYSEPVFLRGALAKGGHPRRSQVDAPFCR